MQNLTARQQQVYDFIVRHLETYGYAPTLQEIAAHLQVSGNVGILRHLSVLEKKGYIRRTPGSSRGLTLLQRSSAVSLPVLGAVAAGPWQEAIENIETYLNVDAALVRDPGSFVLRIKGDSMLGAHILDGDYIVVRPQASADNGDIVVALLDGEATVKRFYREAGQIRLQPENPLFEPIILSAASGQLTLLGKVTGVMRQLEF